MIIVLCSCLSNQTGVKHITKKMHLFFLFLMWVLYRCYFFLWTQVTVCILCFQAVGLPLVFLIGQVYLATNSPSFCLSKTVLFSLILKDNFAWSTVFSFLLFVLLLSLTSMIADEKSTQSYHRSLLCDNMLLSHCFQFYLSTVCL